MTDAKIISRSSFKETQSDSLMDELIDFGQDRFDRNPCRQKCYIFEKAKIMADK